MSEPKLEMVSVVTPEQGETFAEEWFDTSLVSGLLYDACQIAKIIEWPENDDDAQERHHKITDEICKRTFEAAKGAITEAFVRVATAVLARESRRR